jgi:8-oxo-dGTP diphosphatase
VKVCASGILLKDNRILLGKRSPNQDFYPNVWDTIGGHCEGNENPEQTLIRELKEEIGIIPVAYVHIAILDEPEPTIRGNYQYHIYLVTSWNGSPENLSQEHSELKWFKIEDAKKLELAHLKYPGLFENIKTNKKYLIRASHELS